MKYKHEVVFTKRNAGQLEDVELEIPDNAEYVEVEYDEYKSGNRLVFKVTANYLIPQDE